MGPDRRNSNIVKEKLADEKDNPSNDSIIFYTVK
jgi:hypothetical protein